MIPIPPPPRGTVRRRRHGVRLRTALAALLVAVPLIAIGSSPAQATDTALTAAFEGVPDTHDGETAFTFRLSFSEAVSLSYTVLRDSAFTVTHGSVTGARRVDGRSDLWEITVEPAEVTADTVDDDITVELPTTAACGDAGAVCTSGDAKALSNATEATIAGPLPPPTPVVPEEEEAEVVEEEEEAEVVEEEEEEVVEAVPVELADAHDLGDITSSKTQFLRTRFEGAAAGDWRRYCFTLTETRELRLGLRKLDRFADLHVDTDPGDTDADARTVASSTDDGQTRLLLTVTVRAGSYCARVVAEEPGDNHFRLRHGTDTPDLAELEAREQAEQQAEQQAAQLAANSNLKGLRGVPQNNKQGNIQPRQGFTCPVNHDADVDGGTAAIDWGTSTDSANRGHNEMVVDRSASTKFCPAYGEIEPAGDVDWHKVNLTAGTEYRFSVDHVQSIGSSLSFDRADWLEDPAIVGIYNSGGIKLPFSENRGLDFCVQPRGQPEPFCANPREIQTDPVDVWFTPGASDDFYIAVAGHTSPHGAYSLDVVWNVFTDDYAASPGVEAGTAPVGGARFASISKVGEQDWFKVALTAGDRYQVEMRGISSDSGTIVTPWLRGVVAPDLSIVSGSTHRIPTTDTDQITGTDQMVIITAPEDGNYHIVVQGADRLIWGPALDRWTSGWEFGLGTYEVAVKLLND